MPVSADYKTFIQDLLSGFGPVSIRHMFSGAGVYADGVMFAILVDDTLYLKADEISAQAFADEGKGPFTYRSKSRAPVAMSYWEVPERPPSRSPPRRSDDSRLYCAWILCMY
jgi:DNA transformation protein